MKLTGKTQAEIDQAAILAKAVEDAGAAQQLLSATDWYVIRQTETGEEIPATISTARAQARAVIDDAALVAPEVKADISSLVEKVVAP